MVSVILLTLRGRTGWGLLLVAEGNPAARQVVGRELDPNPVPDQDPDVELAHLPRGIRQDRLAGLELHLEHRVRQRLDHLGVHLDRLFFAGGGLPYLPRIHARPPRGGAAAPLLVSTVFVPNGAILPELCGREAGAGRTK